MGIIQYLVGINGSTTIMFWSALLLALAYTNGDGENNLSTTATQQQQQQQHDSYDVLIVGGSISGLSAALSLGRSLRRVLVVDAGQPCNLPSPHAQNLLGFDDHFNDNIPQQPPPQQPKGHCQNSDIATIDVGGEEEGGGGRGIPPSQLHAFAKSDVGQYPTVDLVSGKVTYLDVNNEDEKSTNNEEVFYPIHAEYSITEDETTKIVRARKLILATGMLDLLPPIPGLNECWGKTAIHCPYCDGYEFRHQKTALIHVTSTSTVVSMASILSKFTSDLTIVGKYTSSNVFSTEQLEQFQTHRVHLYLEHEVVELDHTDGILEAIVLDNGERLLMDVVYVRPPKQQSPIITDTFLLPPSSSSPSPSPSPSLHLEMDARGYIVVDPATQQTSIDHVYAVGDCTDSNRALSIAMASGTRAAKMMNYELSMDDWTKAVKTQKLGDRDV